MHNTKLIQKFTLLLCTTFVAFSYVVKADGYIRPANPVMDYVPQNIGIYDTYYENFKDSDCRVCHEQSTSEIHHATEYALSGNCLFCHLDGVTPEPERNCKVCHVDGGPVGNFGFPHHRSDLADSNKCNQCHLQVVETGTVEPPSYIPTSTTPTPYSCENCHWSSGKNPHQASTYEGGNEGKAKFLKDWKSWTGLPKPTNWPDGLDHPKPIEANGQVSSGILGRKPYKPDSGTHHEIDGKVFPKCPNCHASSPDSSPDWDPDNPYLIRFCENCHSIGTLHSIQGHITTDSIYTVDGVRNQTVTATGKCVACHGDALPELPKLPSDIPEIGRLKPNFGPPGIVVDILPASDQCWNEDPINGLCSFGVKMKGDVVKMGQEDLQGNWNWVEVPIYSWSEHLIQIKVPGWTFQPGNTRIKVHKENVGTSVFRKFVVRKHPVIYSQNPSVGNWDQALDIGGLGFGVEQEKVYESGYGYSSYIELYGRLQKDDHKVTSNPGYPDKNNTHIELYKRGQKDKYRVTSNPGYWSPDKISITLKDLLDINKGTQVSEGWLYRGYWNISVVTDFFKDDGDGKYNYGLAGLDTPTNPQGAGKGDELLYRAISDPVCFTVTKDPYINSISPNPVSYNNAAIIYGANFGSARGKSVVRVWNKDMTAFRVAQINSWVSTQIKFVVPKLGIRGYPKESWVQVIVHRAQRPRSNYYQLTITAP